MTSVLVIDEALPHPPDSGKRIRTFELLRRLATSFDVTLAYHDDGTTTDAARRALQDAGIRGVPVPRRPLTKRGARFAWDLLRNVCLPAPYMVMAHRTRGMRAALAAEIANRRPEVIHVEWTPLAANLPARERPPVCIAAHNVEADIWERYLKNEPSLARRAYIALQLRKVRRFEARALAEADAVTAGSEEDARTIRTRTSNEHVVVVPNGVNATYFAPQPQTPRPGSQVLFLGSLDWRPNQDGVTWFLDEVLGPLRAARPEATFCVVGRHPPAWLRERIERADGATLHGSVPDVRPFMAAASVCAVSLRIGGGSRLKICEALAMETPVVSTSIGAEGLDLGDTIVRADGAPAFTRALIDVLHRPEEAAAQARAGRARVLERYEWGRIAPRQAEVWQRLAERGAR